VWVVSVFRYLDLEFRLCQLRRNILISAPVCHALLSTQSDVSICMIVNWSVQLKYIVKLSELNVFLSVIARDKLTFRHAAQTNSSPITVEGRGGGVG